MPFPPAAGGALAPGMARPPMGHPPGAGGPPPTGTGPASGLGGMAGNQMAGMEKLQLGLKALTEAIPMLQLGSEVQSEVMSAIQKIGKHLPSGGAGGDPQSLIQNLAMMARNVKSEPPSGFGALMGGGAGGGAPPASGGAPPAGGPPPPQLGA